MARPPLPLGTWGEIRAKRSTAEGVKPERWVAIAQFRDRDGKTRQVERSSTTEDKAKRALRKALTDRAGNSTDELTPSSRLAAAADLYLKKIKTKRVGTTYDRYEGRLRLYVLPRIGQLLIRECNAGRIEDMFDQIRKDNPTISASTLRGIRTVVSGTLQVAIRHEVISHNPARQLEQIEGGPKRKPTAYDAEQLSDFLTKLDADKVARRHDMCDLIRFLFGTGVRFGEALALRWHDCNLTDEPKWITEPDSGDKIKLPPRSVWINGNIVAVKGQGLVRHSGKTFKSKGVLGLPDFLFTLLLVRCPLTALDGPAGLVPVFPSGTLGWRHPSNVQRSVRRLRERIGYPEFVTHIGRKTVATALDEAGQTARQIADQLRHSQVSTTQNTYMGRGMVNPEAPKAIDAMHRRHAG